MRGGETARRVGAMGKQAPDRDAAAGPTPATTPQPNQARDGRREASRPTLVPAATAESDHDRREGRLEPPTPAPGAIAVRRRASVTRPVWRAVTETFEIQALALVQRSGPDWRAAGQLIDSAGPELLATVAPRQPGQSPEAWAAHCRDALRRAAREVRAIFEQIAREGSSPHLLPADLDGVDARVWITVAPRSGPCPPGWEAIALLRRSGVARAARLS